MTRTVVRMRVELEVEVKLDGSYELGPALDNVVLPTIIGARLEKDGRELAEVELGDVLVLDSREEDRQNDWSDWNDSCESRTCRDDGDCAVCEEYCDEAGRG